MRAKFVIAVCLQALLLVGIIGYREYRLNIGFRVLLKTAPVDPRDLFRGDYVRLSYDISTLDLERLGAKEDFRRGNTLYVALAREEDGTYRASAVGRSVPAGKPFIRGRALSDPMPLSRWEVTVRDDGGELRTLSPQTFFFKKGDRLSFCLNERGEMMSADRAEAAGACRVGSWRRLTGTVEEVRETRSRSVRVEYGIESYFVEEGKGRAIETARNARELRVEAALGEDGQGIITALVMDGKRLE
jgi:uncharacterized membrane-anchored protein